jgi:ABC transporter substrate binding protein
MEFGSWHWAAVPELQRCRRNRAHSGDLRSVCEWRLDRDRERLGDNPSRFNYWLAALHKLPAVYYERLFVAAGGLLLYGADLTDQYHRAAAYAGRILRGAKPSDLPVVRATKFELVINRQTATTLGLTVPPTLLATADEVID